MLSGGDWARGVKKVTGRRSVESIYIEREREAMHWGALYWGELYLVLSLLKDSVHAKGFGDEQRIP